LIGRHRQPGAVHHVILGVMGRKNILSQPYDQKSLNL
jgi:hypothetical protein